VQANGEVQRGARSAATHDQRHAPCNLEYGPGRANKGPEQVCGQLGLLHAPVTSRWSPGDTEQVPRMAFGASNSSSMAIPWTGYSCLAEQCKLCVHDSTPRRHQGSREMCLCHLARVLIVINQHGLAMLRRSMRCPPRCTAAAGRNLLGADYLACGSGMTLHVQHRRRCRPQRSSLGLGVHRGQAVPLQHRGRWRAAAGSRMPLRRPPTHWARQWAQQALDNPQPVSAGQIRSSSVVDRGKHHGHSTAWSRSVVAIGVEVSKSRGTLLTDKLTLRMGRPGTVHRLAHEHPGTL